MPLSDVKVRNAKAVPPKTHRLWDSGGLYLEVSPAGGKLWRYKYRFQAKEKLLALGKWNTVSLGKARALRDDWKKILANGRDPGAVRKQAKRDAAYRGANSF